MKNNGYDYLKQALIDAGERPEDASIMAEVDENLRLLPDSITRKDHKAQVLNLMLIELPEPKTRMQQVFEWYPIALLLSQFRVIRRELWIASATVLILGLFITLTSPAPDLFAFKIIAPLVAAGSIAMIYDDTVRIMLEIEETTRASARLLLLARMTLVFGFNLTIALMGSVLLAFYDNETLLVPLIMSWLAPMTFLAGFAFFLSIVANDTLFAAITSMLIWIGHIILSDMHLASFWLQLLSMPGLSDPTNRPFLLIGGVLLMAVSLWIVGIIDRRTG